MSDSESDDSKPANSRPSKVFVTGMDGACDLKELESELRDIFGKYGELEAVVPKRSFNQTYCFAFIDFKEGLDATVAVEKENHRSIGGKKVSVELQDDSRRRKGADLGKGEITAGCYECGKPGHFARECRNKKQKLRGRSPSESPRSRDRKKKRRRHRSSSSESRSLRKRQKRKHSRSRDRKNHKSKKSKKDRRRSRSYSD